MFSKVFSYELTDTNIYPVSGATVDGGGYVLGTNVNNLDGDHVNASVTYHVSAADKGIYSLKIYYFTPVNASLTLYLNNVKQGKVQFTPSSEGGWDNSVASIYTFAELDKGEQDIKLVRESDDTNYVALGSLAVAELKDTVYRKSAAEAALTGEAYLYGKNVNNLDKDHAGSGATYSFKNVQAGTYTVRLYYFTSADTATHSLFLDDSPAGKFTYTACSQGSWDNFSYLYYTDVEVSLREGDNNLTVKVDEDDINFAAIGDMYLIRKDKAASDFFEIKDNKTELTADKKGIYNIRLFYTSDKEGNISFTAGGSIIAEVSYEVTGSASANFLEVTTELPAGNISVSIQPEDDITLSYAVLTLIEEIQEPETEANPPTSDPGILLLAFLTVILTSLLKKMQRLLINFN